MLRAVLTKYVLGIRYNVELLDRLRADRSLRDVCGFGASVPSEPTLSRFTTRLLLHQGALTAALASVTTQLRNALPDDAPPLGESLAVDSTAVETFANPNRKRVKDPDACWGVKRSAKAKDGKIQYLFGYKVHMVADANHGVPLEFLVTPGNASDSPLLPPLLEQLVQTHLWVKPKVVIGDRGYDAQTNYAAVAHHGAVPIIHIRHTGTDGHPDEGIRTKCGIPSCEGWRTMAYVRTDPQTGHHLFRCPDEACHLRQVASGGDLDCRSEVWVRPWDNLREVGYVLRGSDEWVEYYSKRQAVERIFRSLKGSRNLEGHRHRGQARVWLHATLSVLAF